MKTIEIKLNNSNKNKLQKLEDVYSLIQLISKDYILFKKWQLETRNFDKEESKEKYKQYRTFELNSALIQQIMKHCDKVIYSYIDKCKKKHKLVKFPYNIKCPIILRNDGCFQFNKNKKSKKFEYWLHFLRIKFPLILSEYHKKVLENFKNKCVSQIIKNRKNEFVFKFTFDENEIKTKNIKFLGIDLGIQHPIVCSDGHIIGNGKLIKHKKLEFQKKRSSQQSKKNEISLKQLNWQKEMNHKISKQLIDYALSKEMGVLVLEKLKGHNLSNKKYRKYSWAFKQLITFIEYKAKSQGIKVIYVNPAYTSQTCSKCGLKEKSNRKTRGKFSCISCGNILHADINAARNILNFSVQNESCELDSEGFNLEVSTL